MAILAPTFDFMKVAPGDDAHLYDYLSDGDGIDPSWGTLFKLSVSGLTVNVGTGMALIKGRMIKNTSNHEISIPANSNGSIVITIDLTKNNTFVGTPGDDNYTPVNNQVRIERVDTVVQQDILNGGSIYMFEIGTYTSDGSSVTLGTRNFNKTSKSAGTNLLFYGSANWNVNVKLPDNYRSYHIIQVLVSFLGNVSSMYFIRDNDGEYSETRCSGINLTDSFTDKGIGYMEASATIDVLGNVKLKTVKCQTGGGVVTSNAGVGGDVVISRVIGMR